MAFMEPTIPITQTKLITPRRRTELLTRARLIDLVNELIELKLTIVAAPAGYGKTSLLVDFAQVVKMPVCWLALDPLDQDPHRFVAHFIASIKTKFPNCGKGSMAALQSMSQDRLNLESIVSLVVNEAYENISEHFILVLDDYHLVEESKPVTQFINQFLQTVDENCHTIICSRTLLNLPDMPLLVARSQVGGLSFEELAFRADEIQTLWQMNYHQTLSESEANDLARETEGWITGLLLSNQLTGKQIVDRLRVARVSGVKLYDYLAQQVFERQSKELQQFLLQTSILEEFDAGLCEEVINKATGEEGDWRGIMDQALRQNLFIIPVGEEGMWLRYHHLFRDFLQAKMMHDFPREAEKIQLSLAEYYEDKGEWERSYSILLRLGKSSAITGLIEHAGLNLIVRGKVKTLSEWLGALPQDVLVTNPVLTSLQGTVAIIRGDSEQGINLISEAISAFRTKDDKMAMARSLIRRSTAHRVLGEGNLALADIEEALEISSQQDGSDLIHADALFEKGVGLYYQGRLNESRSFLADAYRAYQLLGDQETMAKVSMQTGMVLKALGLYPAAEKAYLQALEYYETTGNIIWQADLLNNLGILQHMQGHYESAVVSFGKSIQYAKLSGYLRLEAYALASIGDLYRDIEAFQEAGDAFQRSRMLGWQLNDRYLIFYLDLAEASMARLQGQVDKAKGMIRSAQKTAEDSGSRYQEQLCLLERGALNVGQKVFRDGHYDLSVAGAFFDQEGYQSESLRAHFYMITTTYQLNDRPGALNHLDKVFSAVNDPGNRNLIISTGREQRKYLDQIVTDPDFQVELNTILQIVEAGSQGVYGVRRQLRRQTLAVPLGPPKVIINSMGRIQVKINNHMITGAEWQTQTARDLFLLLLFQPNGLTKEEIGIILWPESSLSELRLRFKNTIYRLRKAVGKDVILFEDNIYWFNRSLDYEDDAESFLREVELGEKAEDLETIATHFQAAIKYYKGDYLPDLDYPWANGEREHLHQAYLDVLLKLADHFLEQSDYSTALSYSQRALKEDTYLEEAHRLAMRAYGLVGNRAAVIRQYELCRQALMEELGTDPSDQTQILYENLIA
jgi:LuxR family transcriptional regulator, maltose regulon positive regulatory protein